MTDGLCNDQICWGPFKKRMWFYHPNWVRLLSSYVTHSLYWLSKTTTLAFSCCYWCWCWCWDRRQLKKILLVLLEVAVAGALAEADVIFSIRCQSSMILFSWRASWGRSPLLEQLLPWPLRGSWGRGFSRGSFEICLWKSAGENLHRSQPSEVCSNCINKTEIHLSSVLGI